MSSSNDKALIKLLIFRFLLIGTKAVYKIKKLQKSRLFIR
ncbi:hypothetical protein N476_04050 [Pseudoalteromonas luteoviolacea H33]|uniref:Uncharacterized protein n=1 Tax=Pseudoalteromonas luteoviolacea H33 TaxID=1365251 RepID=A0A167BAA7_9GAMM|nr:hypothetical protein N476_04050 [Pseudoalteromonas luteoviolacea H33]KZN75036.1 hypothetical protein N477_19350 [Pseudoalteromonas luteoviolacea H33-S]